MRLLFAAVLSAALASAPASLQAASEQEVYVLPFGIDEVTSSAKTLSDTDSPRDGDRFAWSRQHRVSTRTHGQWNTLVEQYRAFSVWTFAARAPGAVNLGLEFGAVDLPDEARLVVSNSAGAAHELASHEISSGTFTTPLPGDELHLSLKVPLGEAESALLEVVHWNVGFRDISASRSPGVGLKSASSKSAGAAANVNCIAPGSVEPLSQATALIVIAGTSACSATLVNHPDSSNRPFIVSAGHCGDDAEAAGNDPGAEASVYFQQKNSCQESQANGLDTVPHIHLEDRRDGVATIYRDPDRASGGDVFVAELKSYPPPDLQVFLSGYNGNLNAAPVDGNSAFVVHHADQKAQQYWTGSYLRTVTSALLIDGEVVRRSQYYLYDNPDGGIRPGSSGAGFHDADQRLIGVTAGADGSRVFASPLSAAMDNGLAASLGGVREMNGAPPPAAGAPSVQVTADPVMVSPGETFTITWDSSEDAISCEAFGAWSGGLATAGAETLTGPANDLSRTNTETFGVRCESDRGVEGQGTADVDFLPALPSVTITAASTSVSVGEQAILQWDSQRALDCVATGDWSGDKPVSGSAALPAYASPGSRTYGLECSNDGGSFSDSVTIDVEDAQDVALEFTGPATVETGDAINLSWNADNADSCSASGGWNGSRPTQGNDSIAAGDTERTLDFVLSCSGSGAPDSETVTVAVVAPDPDPIGVSLNGPNSVEVGAPVPLSWSSTNANNCTASGAWSGSRGTSGTTEVGPFGSGGQRVFELTCTGEGDPASDQVVVDIVASAPAPTINLRAPSEAEVGEEFTITYNSTNADSCEASGAWSGGGLRPNSSEPFVFQSPGSRTFRLTCTGAGGQANAEQTVVIVPAPAPVDVTTSVDQAEVDSGDLVTVEWTSTNAVSCEAEDDLADALSGVLDPNGFAEVRLDNPGSVDLTITCTAGNGDTDSSSSRVTVVDSGSPNAGDPPSDNSGGGGGIGLGVILLGLLAVFRRDQLARQV